jgi:hypothetical protein
VLLMLATGCGASSAPSRTNSTGTSRARTVADTPPARLPHGASDAQRARFGLIRMQDIPAKVVAQDASRNHASCSPRRLFSGLVTAIATTPRYRTRNAELQESVLLFRDAATAARAFRTFDTPRTHRCVDRDVRQSAIARLHHQVADVSELTITVEPVGQQSSSYRVVLPIPQHDASVDVLVSRIGRALSSSSLVWRRTPLDLTFQEALARHIAAQAQRALS